MRKIITSALVCGILASNFALTLAVGPDGTLDSTFGQGGTERLALSTQYGNPVEDSLVDSNQRIVLAGNHILLSPGADLVGFLTRENSDGSLDPTFGSGGVMYDDVSTGSGFSRFESIDVTNTDSIIVGQTYFTSIPGFNYSDFLLSKYTSNGVLDSTFGNGGKVQTDIAGSEDQLNKVEVLSDGKILAAGTAMTGSGNNYDYQPVVVRYNPDGTLDNTFGTYGINLSPIHESAGFDFVQDMEIGVNGEIILMGSISAQLGDPVAFLLRLNSDGTRDSSFGQNGLVLIDTDYNVMGIAMQNLNSPNNIILSGHFAQAGRNYTFITRYDASGLVDTTFANSGIAIVDFPNHYNLFLSDVEVLSDDKIVTLSMLMPMTSPNVPETIGLSKFDVNGDLVSTFGNNGQTVGLIDSQNDQARSLSIQADGKIIVAGFSIANNEEQPYVNRYENTMSSFTSNVANTQNQNQNKSKHKSSGKSSSSDKSSISDENDCEDSELPFTDVDKSNAFYEDIKTLYCANIIVGTENGTKYNPSIKVTRGMMAAYIRKAFDLQIPEGEELIKSPFVDDIEGIYKEDILVLKQLGVISGYGDNTYKPNNLVNRKMLAAYIFNALKIKGVVGVEEKNSTFADIDPTDKFAGKIGYLQSIGVVSGYGSGLYNGDSEVNNDTMAKFIAKSRLLIK